MFLRSKKRCKDGKSHRYFSVVENRRVGSGQGVQRQVLFLGEINDSPQAAWRQTLEVFDESEQRAATLSLFPEDREIPADALDGVQVELRETGVAPAAGVWQLLVGVRTVAAVGAGGLWGSAAGLLSKIEGGVHILLGAGQHVSADRLRAAPRRVGRVARDA